MRPIHTLYPLSACALAATLLVAACGGGGASPPPSIPGSSGFAVDDYIAGGSVICDTNSNGISDAGEITTTTDSSGFFKFSPACTSTIVVAGGTNVDTRLPFVGRLKAPAGSTVVTPLTTLMAEGMTNDQVITALGLPAGTDLKTVDPARKITGQLVNPDLMRKTLVLQQILQKTAESLAGLANTGGDAAKAAIYSEVAAAAAASLKTSSALTVGTAASLDAITAVVTAAVQRVAASTTLPSAVTAGAKTVNPAAMAQVIAGGLKVQADAILNALEANLIATTKSVQSDTEVAAFVKTNAMVLAAAPGTASSTLAATLTATVTQSIGGSGTSTSPTAPAVDGTLIASFDESTPLAVLGFEGADGSYIDDAPPAGGGTGKALHIVRSGTVVYAGVVVTVPTIPFASNRKTLTARVYSPKAGIPFVLKTEYSQGNGTGEIQAATAVTAGWQTLTWVMADVDLTKAYSRIVILPQLGTATGNGIADNYFVDNVALAPAPVVVPPVGAEASCATTALQCIGFAESTIGTDSFGGLAASIANDPVAGASNKVLKIIKGPPNEPWAGTTVFTSAAAKSIDRAGFATSKSVTMRSNSGAAVGTKITLKFENSIDANSYLIAQAVTTSQNAWETLTFNFATPTNGVYNATAVYDKASILPAWSETGGTQPALTASTTFYFDELKYAVAAASGGGGGGASAPTNAPTTVVPSGAVVIYTEASAVANFNPFPNWGQPTTFSEATIASNKSLKYSGLTYEGLAWEANPVDVSAKSKLHMDFWSPDLTSIKVSIISDGKESAYTQSLTTGGWNSVDIDLSNYTVQDLTKIIQIKIESTGAPGTLYVDNIYFWGTNAPISCGTTSPTCAPTTAIPSGSSIIYSDASSTAGLNMAPDWGQNNITRSEVTIASNKSEKYVFGGAPYLYQGIDWTGSAGTTTINVSGKTNLHLDLWSADIASIKISLIGGGETAVTKTLTAGSWNSIDIDLALFTGVDKTKTIQLKLEPITAGTLYVDNVYFWGTAAAGGGGTFAGGIYADDYVGTLPTTAKTTQGGDVGFFYDGRFDGAGNAYTYGGVSGTAQDPAGVHNFYFGLGLTAPAITNGYFGAYVKSPGNAPVSVASFTNLKLNVWGPDQLFKAGSFPTLKVVMQGPAAAGCATNSGGSEVQASFAATTQGAASIYTLPLTSFTLVAGCGGDTTVAQVLAHIAQVNVLLQGTNIQYINKDPNGVGFTNGLNIGSIKFN